MRGVPLIAAAMLLVVLMLAGVSMGATLEKASFDLTENVNQPAVVESHAHEDVAAVQVERAMYDVQCAGNQCSTARASTRVVVRASGPVQASGAVLRGSGGRLLKAAFAPIKRLRGRGCD